MDTLKTYVGRLTSNGACVFVKEVTPLPGGRAELRHTLDHRTDLRNHSPSGVRWGYLGSGPSQLALAICAHATKDDALALQVYQHFKEEVIAKLDPDKPFEMKQSDVVKFIAMIGDRKETKH